MSEKFSCFWCGGQKKIRCKIGRCKYNSKLFDDKDYGLCYAPTVSIELNGCETAEFFSDYELKELQRFLGLGERPNKAVGGKTLG